MIGVEEMENLSTLQAVAAQINTDAVALDALPNPNYTWPTWLKATTSAALTSASS